MTRSRLSFDRRRAVVLAFVLVLLVAACRLISPQTQPTAEPTTVPSTDTPVPVPPGPTTAPTTALPEPTVAPGTTVPEPTTAPTSAPQVRRIEFATGATWTVVQGSLAAGATDEYVLQALAGQTMVAVASPPDGSAVLEIYGLSDGQPLVRSQMRQTSWQGTLPATQDYSIKVISTGAATDYRLQVIIPPLAAPTTAPTTVPTAAPTAGPQARRIEFAPGATSAVVQGSLSAEGIDEYLLRASAGQWMVVTVWSLDNTIVLEIYGVSDGQPLVRSHMRQTSWQGTLPATQDYDIKAVGTGVATSYTLQVTVVSAVTPTLVPQFKRIQFAPGGTSAAVQGNLAAEGIDEYLVGASAGQWMMAMVSSPDDSVVLEIYGVSDGRPLVRSPMRQTSWQGTLPATQDYGVKAVSTGAATSYILQVIIPDRVQFQPGAISAVRQGSLPPREVHEYLLQAMKGQTMTVTITSPGNLVLLEIYGISDGGPLVRVPMDATTWTGVLPNTQDYDIKAVSVTDTPTTYTIEFTVR